eukprot:61749-Prymnesium_polylepis.2
MAAHLADKNTRVGWVQIFDNHATVLQRAWRRPWGARSHAAMHTPTCMAHCAGSGPSSSSFLGKIPHVAPGRGTTNSLC